MKKFTLLLHFASGILIALFHAGCKKEIHEPKTSIATKPLLCTEWGNAWEMIGDYHNLYIPPSSPQNPAIQALVYDNKHYLFRNLQVVIYDGTGWDTIASAVPLNIGQFHNDNFSFTLGNKGYMCIIDPGNSNNSFWEYDFASNTWAQKANFPGVKRNDPNYFSIGNKGYVVGGRSASPRNRNLSDLWEYDPATNIWTQKTGLPATLGRSRATGFSIGNKGYIVNGWKLTNGINPGPEAIYLDHLLEYNPVTDSWAQKTNFPGMARMGSSVFVIEGEAYVGGGHNFAQKHNALYDFYKYSSGTGSWTSIANFPFIYDGCFFGFALNSYGYVVSASSSFDNHIFKYTTKICIPNPSNN